MLTTEPDLTRRELMVTTLATGFALAAQPVAAATITTDAAGLVAGEVRIPVAGGEIPAYRAMPATGGPFPIMLVVQEIFGVHEYIKDVARRFAKAGYLAVAPELYARQGDVSRLQNMDDIRSVVSRVPDAQVMSDLDAAVQWARNSANGDGARLGINGFCWGGRIVWMYAAHNPALKAGVAWYGSLASGRYPGDKSAVEVAALVKAPVLGLYGGADYSIPLDAREQLRAALKAAGNTKSETIVYPDAPHGFHSDYRPSYREAPAEDGWKRCLAWFKTNGLS